MLGADRRTQAMPAKSRIQSLITRSLTCALQHTKFINAASAASLPASTQAKVESSHIALHCNAALVLRHSTPCTNHCASHSSHSIRNLHANLTSQQQQKQKHQLKQQVFEARSETLIRSGRCCFSLRLFRSICKLATIHTRATSPATMRIAAAYARQIS